MSSKWPYITVAVFGVLLVVFLTGRGGDTPSGKAGEFKFTVGKPAAGEVAPAVKLGATDGSTFDLGALHGQTVLLYFQEGVGCQPCWNQIRDIEGGFAQFKTLGIDRVVTITGDDLNALKQKATDEKLTTPVLSDPGLGVSKTYHANDYGMMGDTTDGHTFIVVGPDGKIQWRADYGGKPDFTMYLPIKSLLADIRAGLKK